MAALEKLTQVTHSVYLVPLLITSRVSSYGKQLDPNSRPSSSNNNMKNIILSNTRGLIQPLIAVERLRTQKSPWLQCML